MAARLIEVIECEVSRGNGTSTDPCRAVVQYYSVDGQLLAERDPHPVAPYRETTKEITLESYLGVPIP